MTSRAPRGASAKPVSWRSRRRLPAAAAQSADLDPQPRAVRLVGVLRAERAGEQRVPRHVAGPGLASVRASANSTGRRASGTTCSRSRTTIAAGVDDQRLRGEQRLEFRQQERALLAARDQPRRRRVERRERLLDLRRERRNARASARLPRRGRARRCCPGADASHGDARRPPARARHGAPAQELRDRAVRAAARHRRGGRSEAGAEPRGSAHGRRSPGRHALRASPVPRASALRGPAQGRAKRARSRPRRRHIARAPPPLSDRRRAPRAAAAPSRASRSPSWAMAMPRSASAGASSRSATRFSAPSGSPVASARAAAVISESIESRHTCHSHGARARSLGYSATINPTRREKGE